MSIALMNQVWNRCPEVKAEARLVLLALADSANDDGICWPTLGHIARKASITEDAARHIVNRLQEQSYLWIVEAGGGRGKGNTYCVTPSKKLPPRVNPVSRNPRSTTSGLKHQAAETPVSETPVSRPSTYKDEPPLVQPPLLSSSLRSEVPGMQQTELALSTIFAVQPVDKISVTHPVFLAVCRTCEIDLDFAGKVPRIRAAAIAKRFLKIGTSQGMTVEDIAREILDFRPRWNVADWRGRQGSAPTPDQLADNFKELMTRPDITPVVTSESEANGTDVAREYRATPTTAAERHAAEWDKKRNRLRNLYFQNGLDPRTCTVPGVFTAADLAGAGGFATGGIAALHSPV